MKTLVLIFTLISAFSANATQCLDTEYFSFNMDKYKATIAETFLSEYDQDGVSEIISYKYTHKGNQARIRDYAIFGIGYTLNLFLKEECMPESVEKRWKGNGEITVEYISESEEICKLVLSVDGTADSGTYTYVDGVETHLPKYDISVNRISNSCN